MSLMAGFDLIVEVSRATVEKLIKASINLNAKPVNPPFELQMVLSSPLSGLVTVIVTDLHLDLFGDRGARVTLAFSGGSVIADAPPLIISLLEGTITVSTEFKLVDSSPDHKVLGVDLATATTDIQFSAPSEARIASALAGSPLDLNGFKTLAKTRLADFIHAQGLQVISKPELHVVPGIIGSISQGRFERLEIRNLNNTSVVLAGMLIPGRPGGDPLQKNVSALAAARDLAISIGPDAFHQLIYCPSLADEAGITVSQLPASCGTAGSFEQDGVKLTSIRDTFSNGAIDINGTVEKSGTCYEAKGSFHARITFYLQGSNLQSTITVDPPSINVDIDWYCTLISAVLGPIGSIIQGVVQASINSSVSKMTSAAGAFGSSAGPGLGTGGFPGASFGHVAVSPEAITLNGFVSIGLPIPETKSVSIAGSVTTESLTPISSGQYRVGQGCMHGTYPYVESAQQQSATFIAVPKLLAQPITLQWTLEAWEGSWIYSIWTSDSSPALVSSAPLTGTTGQATLSGVDCHFPVPVPQGSVVRQAVHVDYSVGTNTVRLRNDPNDGITPITLKVRATDAAGTVVESTTGIGFDGDIVTIGGNYQEQLAKCAWLSHARSKKLRHKNKVPKWVPVDHPGPDEVKRYAHGLSKVKSREAEHLLAHAKLGHGSSFHHAIAPRGPRGKKTKVRKRKKG
jgi:hypothetical protein